MTREVRDRRLLRAALTAAAAAMLLTLPALQVHRGQRQRLADRLRAWHGLQADVARLARYESAAHALRGRAQPPRDPFPAAWPAPGRRELRRLPPVGGWSGVQLELAWPRLAVTNALALLAGAADAAPPWRVARLELQALDEPGLARVDLLLESAVPVPAP